MKVLMTVSSPTCDEVAATISRMRTLRSELPDVEVKEGRNGLPQRIYEALSALANRRGGGLLIFGLEDTTFRPVGGIDVAKLQSDLASLVDQRMSYPTRLEFHACDVDGAVVLAVRVPEAPPPHKPIYYRNKGLIGGSWLRVGNSNHVLSDAEVRAILRSSDRDDTDIGPIEGARLDDLSPSLVRQYRQVLEARSPQSSLLSLPDTELLLAVRAATRDRDTVVPTLAGVLFFTEDPTRWIPGAFVSFLQFAGTEIAGGSNDDVVYLDNARFAGPLPAVLDDVRRRVLARIRRRALLDGLFRREIPEYPDWAWREAIVNAVAHRDYAIAGAHVQVRLFADRLEVQSPGGLFGSVSESTIEHDQSTRNHAVVRLLEDHGLVEQRGIGIDRIIRSMLEAGLERPIFRDSLTSFLVVLRNHTMMDEEAYQWLATFSDRPLNDRQRVALVYAWRTGSIANRDYQRLHNVSNVTATRELRQLVDAALVDRHGTRGSAFYTLVRIPSRRRRRGTVIGPTERRILEHARQHGRITNATARRLAGVEDVVAMRSILRRMVRNGLLAQRGASKQGTYYELGPMAGQAGGTA